MTYGVEVTNTDGSILIGDLPPLLQVIEKGTLTIQSTTNTYFGYAYIPESANGKQIAFSFSGTASVDIDWGSGISTYGVYPIRANNGTADVSLLAFPKSWVGQSIDYLVLDFPTSASTGYGIELRNAANQVVLTSSKEIFIIKDRHPQPYSSNGTWGYLQYQNPYPPYVVTGSASNFSNTVPTGKKPYILLSGWMRDSWSMYQISNGSVYFTNNWSVTHNIHSVTNTNTSIRNNVIQYAMYSNYGYSSTVTNITWASGSAYAEVTIAGNTSAWGEGSYVYVDNLGGIRIIDYVINANKFAIYLGVNTGATVTYTSGTAYWFGYEYWFFDSPRILINPVHIGYIV